MNLLNFLDGTIIRAIINGKTVDLEYHVEFPALYFQATSGITCDPHELQHVSDIAGVEWKVFYAPVLDGEDDHRTIVDNDGDKWDYCDKCESWWCWDNNDYCPHGVFEYTVSDIDTLFGIKARVNN